MHWMNSLHPGGGFAQETRAVVDNKNMFFKPRVAKEWKYVQE